MALILSIWLILIILLAFFNIKSCICLYTAYLILVPFLNINISGINLQYNLVNTLILLGFILKYHKRLKNIDYQLFKPFIFLFAFYLILIPFQKFSLSYSLNAWRYNIMSSVLFPFVIWNVYKFDNSLYKPLKYTFITCISIALVYGLVLISMPGINPYLMMIMPINGKEFNDLYAFAGDGRVFGRISSVFGHPMTFGLFLSLSSVYLYHIRKSLKYNVGLILLLLCLLNILFCGVRSAIGGTIIGFTVYLILSRKIKLALSIILIVICLMSIVQLIPGMDNYVSSITDFDNKKQSINGSSIDMRIEQLDGALNEIETCPFVGKGYGWVEYYKETKGDHPILLAFESLIFVSLCDNGFFGIIAWILSIYLCYKQSRHYKEKWKIIFTLYVTYIAYSCITGEYGYLKYTMIFYAILFIDLHHISKIERNIENS